MTEKPLWDEIVEKIKQLAQPNKPDPAPSVQPVTEPDVEPTTPEQTRTSRPLGDTMPTISDKYTPEHGEESPVRIEPSESPEKPAYQDPPKVITEGGAEETPIGGEFRPVGKRKGGTRPTWA